MFQPKVQRELVEKESCEKNKLLRDRVAHPLTHMHTCTLAPIFQHIISHPHTLCGFPSRLDVGRVCSTAFGKHCECNAHKFTHLKRLPPLGSHLLLLSHCVLTQHEGKKNYLTTAGDRTTNTRASAHCDKNEFRNPMRFMFPAANADFLYTNHNRPPL